MKRKELEKPATLLDRFGMAALSGLGTFIPVVVLWLLFVFRFGVLSVPFELVLWLTGVMALLGFFLAENLITSVLGKLWEAILVFFRAA